jgi:ABC-type xylose transport system permease subunit
MKSNLTMGELLGFVGFIAGFVFLFWALDLEGQSWQAIVLLAVFLVGIAGYRAWLKRRHP